ncbi:hypothetical protein [Paraburkholderia phenoliruptrix]|uniref:hypothetical protein n=1 Tax=Paraburkholderia phenoliruptrix TaxID=252970 RepID=UPI0034CF6278
MPVTKQPPMETYQVRDEHGYWAATIAIRAWECPRDERTGTLHAGEIIINSDYGTFATSWGNMGAPLKQFLCKINRGYLLNRLTEGKTEEFDIDASMTALKRDILKLRRDREITSEEARDAMDDLPDEDSTEEMYSRHIWNMDLYREGDPPYHLVKKRERPLIVHFYPNVWLPFIEHLKTELS